MNREPIGSSAYQLALEATNDYILLLDFIDREAILLKSDDKSAIPGKHIPLEPLCHVHHADTDSMQTLLDYNALQKAYSNGVSHFTIEFRMVPGSIWMSCTLVPLPAPDGSFTQALCSMKNIHGCKCSELEILRRSRLDPLTELYNKKYTEELIDAYLGGEGQPGTLFLIDIDCFKEINDSLGHLCGDAVLSDLAQQLRKQIPENEILGRVGGDEFIVFLKGEHSLEERIGHAEMLMALFRRPIPQEGIRQYISCSIGIAASPFHGFNFLTLFSHADRALYQAKSLGKNRYYM